MTWPRLELEIAKIGHHNGVEHCRLCGGSEDKLKASRRISRLFLKAMAFQQNVQELEVCHNVLGSLNEFATNIFYTIIFQMNINSLIELLLAFSKSVQQFS